MCDDSDWEFGQEQDGDYMDSLFCHPHDIEAEMAEWEAAHQQQLASARVGAEDTEPSAKSTNSGISEVGHAIEESASAVEKRCRPCCPLSLPRRGCNRLVVKVTAAALPTRQSSES